VQAAGEPDPGHSRRTLQQPTESLLGGCWSSETHYVARKRDLHLRMLADRRGVSLGTLASLFLAERLEQIARGGGGLTRGRHLVLQPLRAGIDAAGNRSRVPRGRGRIDHASKHPAMGPHSGPYEERRA
jgi:hypothetical protein